MASQGWERPRTEPPSQIPTDHPPDQADDEKADEPNGHSSTVTRPRGRCSKRRRPGEALWARALDREGPFSPNLAQDRAVASEPASLVARDGERMLVRPRDGVAGHERRSIWVAAGGQHLVHRVPERQNHHPPVVE